MQSLINILFSCSPSGLINSFNTYFLNTYYVSDPMQGTGEKEVSKTGKVPLHVDVTLEEETDNNQVN